MGNRGRSRTHRCSAFVQQSRFESHHACPTSHSGGGICRIGRVRDLSRKHHAQFSHSRARAFEGTGRKREEHRLRIVSWTGKPACEKRRRCTHDRQSEAIAGDLFSMSLECARAISTAAPASGARRQNELRRLPQPAWRHRRQRRWNQCAAVNQGRWHGVSEPKRNLFRLSHRAAWAFCL